MFGKFAFQIPAQFQAAYSGGELMRYGALLKDAGTGRVVAHLQETGVMQSLLQSAGSFDPTGATGLIGVIQNAQINNKLNAMQSMMGTIQGLQIATLASSVAGIGVTVASTALILTRVNAVQRAVDEVSGKVDAVATLVRDIHMDSVLSGIATALERVEEAGLRPEKQQVRLKADEQLHLGFNELLKGMQRAAAAPVLDLDFLTVLTGALMLSHSGQMRVLFEANELEDAKKRARRQFQQMVSPVYLLPRDVLRRKAPDARCAEHLSETLRELMLRAAATPGLIARLISDGVAGDAYLRRIDEEEQSPVLLLPV